jgi:hypothetical protein
LLILQLDTILSTDRDQIRELSTGITTHSSESSLFDQRQPIAHVIDVAVESVPETEQAESDTKPHVPEWMRYLLRN